MFKEALFGPVDNFPFGLMLILLIWSIFWKGLALWSSARKSQKYWFIALLVLNTVGILPITYLAFFQKKGETAKK